MISHIMIFFLVFLPLIVDVVRATSEDVRVRFRMADGYKSMTPCQQDCAAGRGTYSWLYSTVSGLMCGDSYDCVCADPQRIADELDICLNHYSACWTVNNYNTIIEFFGKECGFQPIYKVCSYNRSIP